MLTDNDLKSYIKDYLADRKITYTRLDKHDRAIEVLINENSRLNNIINELEKKLKELIRDSLKGYEKYEENWEKRMSVSNTWLTGRDDYMSVLNYLQKLKGNNKEYFYIASKEVEEDLLGDSSNE